MTVHALTPSLRQNGRMVALLEKLAVSEGHIPTRLPNVRLMRSNRYLARTPIMYDPSIVIVAQGRKIGSVGNRSFVYDADHYLALAVPLPFECETFATPEQPVLGIAIGITSALVAGLLFEMELPEPEPDVPTSVEAVRLDPALSDVVIRLLECLGDDESARILGPAVVREIVYHVLRGPSGPSLRGLAAMHSQFGRIVRVINLLHADYARAHTMPMLAREAGMSVSGFHAHFKTMTGFSPLQYLKRIRLHKAQVLMVNEGANAALAARLVGYESPSQFSREFKRLFGDAPTVVAEQLRSALNVSGRRAPPVLTFDRAEGA